MRRLSRYDSLKEAKACDSEWRMTGLERSEMNNNVICLTAACEIIGPVWRSTILTNLRYSLLTSGNHELEAKPKVDRMPHLYRVRFSSIAKTLFAATIAAAILPTAGTCQTLATTDSALNTGAAASTSYKAPGTSGTNAPVHLATNSSKNLWLLYNNPWGIKSGSGTMTQTYGGNGSITTTINLTGLPGGGVDAYPFVLYGCDPWMDCFQDQPPQFPKQLSAMSSLMVDISYSMTGNITGSDIDLLFDEWVCNSATPSDSSQCLEIEVLPYYSFVYFGGGTFIKTINEPVTLNGITTTFSFDEYVGGPNVLFYPHVMPGLPAGELKFNLLDFLKSGVTAFGNNSYQYVAGIELGTEFGAKSTQTYTLTLSKFEIDQSSGTQPSAPTNLTAIVTP